MSQLPNNEKFDYGIVANWGPDHLSTAEMLIKLGCKRLIIEKPISNSLSELVDFRNKFEDKDIFVTVHHFFRFTNFLDTFRKAEKKYNFGEPVGIRLSGGAACLSTSGTHYLDLACEILSSEPNTVSADLKIDYINPRDQTWLILQAWHPIGWLMIHLFMYHFLIEVVHHCEQKLSIEMESLK